MADDMRLGGASGEGDTELAHTGLISTERSAEGGPCKEPKEISFLDIVEAIEARRKFEVCFGSKGVHIPDVLNFRKMTKRQKSG